MTEWHFVPLPMAFGDKMGLTPPECHCLFLWSFVGLLIRNIIFSRIIRLSRALLVKQTIFRAELNVRIS